MSTPNPSNSTPILGPGYRGDAALLRAPNTDEFSCREIFLTTRNQSESSASASIAFECSVSPLSRQLHDCSSKNDENDALFNNDERETKSRIQRLPSHFLFSCREASYGVLTHKEQQQQQQQERQEEYDENDKTNAEDTSRSKSDDENDNGQDDPESYDDDDDGVDDSPFFLLNSSETYPYALAGKTGFQIWPGTRIMVDALTFPRSTEDNKALRYWQECIFGQSARSRKNNTNIARPCRILELGAGVGVVGTSLAAAGAQVIMTDLPTVVSKSLIPNLRRNATRREYKYSSKDKSGSSTSLQQQSEPPPAWLAAASGKSDNDANKQHHHRAAFSVGRGWAATASLDWQRPLQQQQGLAHTCQSIDLIIASDCVWLASMLQGVLNTVQTIFDAHHASSENDNKNNNNSNQANSRIPPKLLLSFQRRDSEMFTTVDRVLHELQHERGWSVICLAWYPVQVASDGDDEKEECNGDHEKETEVFLFEVSPR